MKETKFKQTDIGLIPKDWEVDKLECICNKIGDGIHSTPIYGVGTCYFINGNNLKDGAINITETTQTVSVTESRKHRVPLNKATVLLSINGTIGNVALYKDEDVILGKSAAYLIFKSESAAHFAIYQLQSNCIKKQFYDSLTATTINNLGLTAIRSTQFPFPNNEAEQYRIASTLQNIDRLIESLDEQITKKQAIKQGAMQQLLSGKSRLKGFKGDWEKVKLGEKAFIYRGGSPRPIENYLTNSPDGINWIKIGDVGVGAKYIESTAEKIIPEGITHSRRVYAGDFLLSNSMSFGRPYILKTDGCIHDGWLVIQKYQDSFDVDFLYYLLSSEDIKQQYKSLAAGSSVLNLNKDIVEKVIVSKPEIEEQQAIATILSNMDAELDALQEERNKYAQVKQGMMQQLLTGKTRI